MEKDDQTAKSDTIQVAPNEKTSQGKSLLKNTANCFLFHERQPIFQSPLIILEVKIETRKEV